MQIINISTSDINKLHDYLIENVEGFHRVELGAYGLNVTLPDCGSVQGTASKVNVFFADSLSVEVVRVAIEGFNFEV